MISRIVHRILLLLVLKSLSMIVVYRVVKSGKAFEENVGFHPVNVVVSLRVT